MRFSYISAYESYDEKVDKSNFIMHTHDTYEIYCFLEGEAHYSVEGVVYPLESGDIIILRKSESHYLIPNVSVPYRRIALNFDFCDIDDSYVSEKLLSVFNDRPLGKYNRYANELFTDSDPIYYLRKICNAKEDTEKTIYLLVLLEELYEKSQNVKNGECDNSLAHDNSSKILKYINRHLTEDISLEKLCEIFYISKSQINRNFKKNNGSTLWEYVTVKRLHLAKEMLREGQRPTEIYLKCGFNDYVTFYKAYRKHFGVSPKNDYLDGKQFKSLDNFAKL